MPRDSRNRSERVQPGQAVNLLQGTEPFPPGPDSLRRPPAEPLLRFDVESERTAGAGWQLLTVTAHRDAGSLVEQLSGCRVLPLSTDGPEFAISPARLVGDREKEERNRHLEAMLGLHLREGVTYLLFELRRVDGRADHEVTAEPARAYFDRHRHLNPDWRKASTRLPPGRRIHDGYQHDAAITVDMAQRYIDRFYEFGTHFVSAAEEGDVLIQVAALQPQAGAWIFGSWQQAGNGQAVSGATALDFGAFLGPDSAMEVSRIVSLAGDPELPASLAGGAWRDAASMSGMSLPGLFRAGRDVAGEALAAFRATTTIHVELMSLARFMEYYRAINFERVLRGALMQRWGERVHLPLRRMPEVERSIAAGVLEGDGAGAAGCHRVLSLRGGGPHILTGTSLVQFLDAEPMSHLAPVVRLRDEEFDPCRIACQTMAGALIFENESGSRREAVVDGLRFTDAGPAPDTGWPRVRVRGDIHSLEPAFLAETRPSVEAALESISATLCCMEGDPQRRADAASFARWLAELMPANAVAWYLSRVEAVLPLGASSLPLGQAVFDLPTRDRIRDRFEAISRMAIGADERIRDLEAQLRSQSLVDRGTVAGLRELRRGVSEHYGALLAEIREAHDDAIRRAECLHYAAASALLDAASAMAGGPYRGPADYIVLHVLAAARAERPAAAGAGEKPAHRTEDEAANFALEFAAREALIRDGDARLRVIEELCGALAENPSAFNAGTASDKGMVTPRPLDPADLAKALNDGVKRGPEFQSAINSLVTAWERFASTRETLTVARGNGCRVRMEAWYQSVHRSALPEAVVEAAPDMQIERLRLLSTLGQALRRQRAMLRAAGLEAPAHIVDFEPGAMGYLLALQNRLLANQPVAPQFLSPGRSYA